MKVPVRWLTDLVPTDLSATEIAHKLTMAGLEAEAISQIGGEWDNVFVGAVTRVEPHPNADRLRLVTVEAGEHNLTVVTGAPNIAEGQRVPLAVVGARLIDGYSEETRYVTLKASSIRGVRSEGMVCSEKELGLSSEHEGIMVLEPDAPVGRPLRDYMGDEVIEFEITPNLVHAFSMIGIARELGAIIDVRPRFPGLADLEASDRKPGLVSIDAPDLCSRYVGVIVKNIVVEQSPKWMQQRLLAADVRPINNIVDITNYVMLEWGQPLHAFDLEFLREQRIIVRRAAPGEEIETLDHIKRELDTDTLVIADADRAVAIAGVMGGVDSEINDSTTTILLESASFDMANVRRTARLQKLRTEASARFERGLDPNLAWTAAQRAVALIQTLCPDAQVVALDDAYPNPVEPRQLTMPRGEIKRLLGVDFSDEVVLDILSRLEFAPRLETADGQAVIRVEVPTWRSDITLKADLVEEVARIAGYENLPETLPTGRSVAIEHDPLRRLVHDTQDILVAAGLQEIINYSMISDADLKALVPGSDGLPDRYGFYARPEYPLVTARNPLRPEWQAMRPTLLPSLLKNVAENLKYSSTVKVFETASVYQPLGTDELPDERQTLSCALAGRATTAGLYSQDRAFDFFDLKGVFDEWLSRLGAAAVVYQQTRHPSLHPGRAAEIMVAGESVGTIGELHPAVGGQFGIDLATRIAVAEVDLVRLSGSKLLPLDYRAVSRFQPVEQDFAVLVEESVTAAEVADAIRAGAGALLNKLELFDIYRGSAIESGQKSLAYRVTVSAPDRMLEEKEIERIRKRIEGQLKRRVNGVLRG